LNGVLGIAADVATRFVACKRDRVVRHVHVRQPEQMREIAISGVVVSEGFTRAQSQGVNTYLERVATRAPGDIGLAADSEQLAIERCACRERIGSWFEA
jgi:hypothetical protein